MKSKYLKWGFFLFLLLIPTIMLGQNPTSTEDYNKILQYLKGDGTFEKWFFEGFKNLDTRIAKEAFGAAMLGKTIGGIGAFLYLGYMGWQMASGDREWEITPMLRPLFIGLILHHWTAFYNLIEKPFELTAQSGHVLFEKIEKEANTLRVKRFQKQNQLYDYVVKKRAEELAKKHEVDNTEKSFKEQVIGTISEGWDKLKAPVEEWFIRMDFQFQKLIAELIEAISLSILRICTYFIFFIQKIWSYILIVLGPIAIGMALIPGFESSLNSWIAKFININLYSFIAYAIINIGQQLIISAYQMEIERYDLMIADSGVADSNTIMAFINGNGMIHISMFTCVAYIITGVALLMVPTIADAIVSAGGANMMSKMKQAASTASKGVQSISKAGSSLEKSLNFPKGNSSL